MGLFDDPVTDALNAASAAALRRQQEEQERATQRAREADERNRQN